MKQTLILVTACLLGLAAGEFLTTDVAFRAWLGRLVRRGDLLFALVERRGVYRNSGWSVDDARLELAAGRQFVPEASIEEGMNLLRAQFPDDKTWRGTLDRAGVSPAQMRSEVAGNLRERAWTETKLASENLPNEKEERRFYQDHLAQFQEPLRFRASHLFLAAPDGYPDDVIEAKRALCDALSARLHHGESFSDLVAEYSEDENSKGHDGDLNYFAEARILPELWSAAQSLAVGKTSAPIRSRLGFHLFRLTGNLPPQQLTFEQVEPEIANELANEKRAANLATLLAQLPGKIQFATPGN